MTTLADRLAEHERLRTAAYDQWERLGRPEGQRCADCIWRQAQLAAYMPPHPIVFEVEKRGDDANE